MVVYGVCVGSWCAHLEGAAAPTAITALAWLYVCMVCVWADGVIDEYQQHLHSYTRVRHVCELTVQQHLHGYTRVRHACELTVQQHLHS